MITFSTVLILLMSATSLCAQGKKIKLYQKSGKVLTYDIDAISKMSLTRDTSKWPTYLMEVFYDSSMQEYATNQLDSMKATTDSTHGQSLIVSFGPHWDGYPLHSVDSITFTPAPPPPMLRNDSINDNAVLFPVIHANGQIGTYQKAIWAGNRIYYHGPLGYFEVDSAIRIRRDSMFVPGNASSPFSINRTGDRMLCIASFYNDVSTGWLGENDPSTGAHFVLDSGKYNSSAVYVPSTDNIIYYSYGSYSATNKLPADAGYYLFDRSSGSKTLLLHHISTLGPAEMVNGFDISPDGKKLLIGSTGYYRMPRVIEYDLTTHVSDTLRVSFNTSYDRWALWLRYNHDGSKILYSSYPLHSMDGTPNDSSEVGIIDRATLAKQVLNVNPESSSPWVCVFPEWSPDETKIVYCAGFIATEPPGYEVITNLYVLKTLR